MAIQITPNGNVLVSGPMTPCEKSLLYARLNAGSKTMAKALPKQRKQKE
jgi:hypothetical protein